MVGVAVRADGAEHAHLGMLGLDILHKAPAFPGGVDDEALATRNHGIAVGLNRTVYKRLN